MRRAAERSDPIQKLRWMLMEFQNVQDVSAPTEMSSPAARSHCAQLMVVDLISEVNGH